MATPYPNLGPRPAAKEPDIDAASQSHPTDTRYQRAEIEADSTVPLIRITRDFRATPAQLLRAHIDPDLYARWVGPHDLTTRIDHWDARYGGSWAFTNIRAA